MDRQKAIFNWSGGKDSSLALYKILQTKEFHVEYLLTTLSKEFKRISQHGVREILLDQQSESIGIPLSKLYMPDNPDMETYNNMLEEALNRFKNNGINYAIFGDIFLEDLRVYREKQLNSLNYTGIFPLWKQPTAKLAREFLQSGFKAIIVCIDEMQMDKRFIGKEFDASFLNELPDKIDPCGENGEFHTYVYDGPIFKQKINFEIGEIIYRKYIPSVKEKQSENNEDCKDSDTSEQITTGFWYCDLIPC